MPPASAPVGSYFLSDCSPHHVTNTAYISMLLVMYIRSALGIVVYDASSSFPCRLVCVRRAVKEGL